MPSTPEATARVFFALLPPPPLQRALAELARDTAREARGKAVPAENLHMTLAFIGAWPVTRLAALWDTSATVRGEPLRITLDARGAFRRAGIAWIGASVSPPALIHLAATLADELSAAGVTLDARPLRPHLTLARHCKGPCPQGKTGPFNWDVDRLVLMRSQTHAEGARYGELASRPLGATISS